MLGKNTRKKTSWISSLTSVPSWHGMDNILSSQKGEKSDSTSSMLIFPHTMPAAMLNKENDHWGCSFCLQIFEYCLLVTRTPGTFAHLAADTTGCSCCNGIFPQSYFISSSFFFPILRKFNHQAWLGKKKRRREKKKKERWHCNHKLSRFCPRDRDCSNHLASLSSYFSMCVQEGRKKKGWKLFRHNAIDIKRQKDKERKRGEEKEGEWGRERKQKD